MANVIGEKGTYELSQIRKNSFTYRYLTWFIMIIMGFVGGIGSTTIVLSLIFTYITKTHISLVLLVMVIISLALAFLTAKYYLIPKFNELNEKEINFWKGLDGEQTVGCELELLPNQYTIYHAYETPDGDIDHIVIGPTGIFFIDTKNWKGTVTAEKGELLCNGQPTSHKEIRNLEDKIHRIMTILENQCKHKPYFRGILAFPYTRVDVNWGDTGKIHCMRKEKLQPYIAKKQTAKQLDQTQVHDILEALQQIEKDNTTT